MALAPISPITIIYICAAISSGARVCSIRVRYEPRLLYLVFWRRIGHLRLALLLLSSVLTLTTHVALVVLCEGGRGALARIEKLVALV